MEGPTSQGDPGHAIQIRQDGDRCQPRMCDGFVDTGLPRNGSNLNCLSNRSHGCRRVFFDPPPFFCFWHLVLPLFPCFRLDRLLTFLQHEAQPNLATSARSSHLLGFPILVPMPPGFSPLRTLFRLFDLRFSALRRRVFNQLDGMSID